MEGGEVHQRFEILEGQWGHPSGGVCLVRYRRLPAAAGLGGQMAAPKLVRERRGSTGDQGISYP